MPQNYDACRPATTPPATYTNTGSEPAFATGFPSLKQNDIVVFTGNAATNTWTAVPQTDYSVNSQNPQNIQQVVFNTAPGTDVMIMRRTDLCTLVRTFQAGQSIRAQDLNNALLQQLYLHQEMYEFISEQFFNGGDLVLDGLASLGDTYWDKTDETIDSGETWVGGDAHVATTGAIDNRIDAKITASEGNQNLQAVTDRGNTTTRPIRAASLETGNTLLPATTTLNADGTASFCSGNAVIDASGEMTLNSDINIRNVDYTWPSSAGEAGTVLSTTGNGELAWTTPEGEADTLQSVCDRGNTTTTGATFGDVLKVDRGLDANRNNACIAIDNNDQNNVIILKNDGSADFAGGSTKLYANGSVDLYRKTTTGTNGLLTFHSDVGGTREEKAIITASGSAEFDGSVQSGGDPEGGSDNGIALYPDGFIRASRTNNSDSIWIGFKTGTSAPTSAIKADGSATFSGNIQAAGLTDGTTTKTMTEVLAGGGGSGTTDLGIANRGATTLDVTSSTGDNATIPAATTSLAGLMTADDKTLLGNVGNPLLYQGTVDLTTATVPANPEQGWTYANTGTGAVNSAWVAVSSLDAGDDVTTGDLVVWNGLQFTHIPTGGQGIAQNLQQVTDLGNTTTNGATFGSDVFVTGSEAFTNGAANLAESYSKAAFRVTPASNSSNCINIGPEGTGSNMYLQGSNNPGNAARDIYAQRFGGSIFLGDSNIELNADGSGLFESSLTVTRTNAAGLPSFGSYDGLVVKAQSYTGGNPTTNAKISADGSADFASGVQVGTTGADTTNPGGFVYSTRWIDNDNRASAALNGAANDGNLASLLVIDRSDGAGVETVVVKPDGSASFAAGKTIITDSGNVKSGDFDTDVGAFLGSAGTIAARIDGGGNVDNCFTAYNGGTTSEFEVASIHADGSASFAGPIDVGTVSGSTPFAQITAGSVQARPNTFSDLTFAGYATSGADPVFSVNGQGSAKFGTGNSFFDWRQGNGVCQISTNSGTANQALLYGQSQVGGSTLDAFKFTAGGSAEFSGKITSAETVGSDPNNTVVTKGYVDAAGGFDFPSGTVMLFYQANAPTGFTKVATQNNKALRVVSGSGGGTGGSVDFTTAFSDKSGSLSGATVGGSTLSTSQMPSHSHLMVATEGGTGTFKRMQGTTSNASQNTGSTGSSSSHTHSITGGSVSFNVDVQYIDLILASRN